jgi:hypothetical protein
VYLRGIFRCHSQVMCINYLLVSFSVTGTTFVPYQTYRLIYVVVIDNGPSRKIACHPGCK